MRKHSKKFFVILLMIATAGSAFYIYSAMKTAKAYSFFKPLQNIAELPSVKAAVDYGKKSVSKIGEKIKNQASALEKSASETTDEVKNSAFEFLKENINSGLNAVGGVLGVDEKLIDSGAVNATTTITKIIKEKCD
jgi:hypothetical protein